MGSKRPHSPPEEDLQVVQVNRSCLRDMCGSIVKVRRNLGSESVSNKDSEDEAIVKSSSNFMYHQDPRKRRSALSDFLKVSHRLDFSLYPEFSELLNDDYERCRSLAIQLILIMSAKYGDCLVFQKGTYEQVRLEDDAFAKISRMITDSDVQVRVEAASSLSKFKAVSLNYLLATLDKKADIEHSGAFVFGLEDEKKDVRMAALNSLCHLSKINSNFAERSLDHIVDMFNDEIDDIRLKAIHCLQDLDNIKFQDDQVEIILSALDSPSMNIREALHNMLAKANLSSARSLRRCTECVLNNLTRYPQDKHSIFNCFKFLGLNHSNSVRILVNELLAVHPYLELLEQSLINPLYVATLILIFNAASKIPRIYQALESHTLQHETYIRHTLPEYMPQTETLKSQAASALFFVSIFDRLGKMLRSNHSAKSKITLMEMSLQDLKSFGLVEPEFRASTEFYQIVIDSILVVGWVLSNHNWVDMRSLKPIRKVLNNTYQLLRRFNKLTPVQVCCIQQLRVQTLAMELVVFIRRSNATGLDLCDNFMEEVRHLETFLNDQPFLDSTTLDKSSITIMDEVGSLDEPKPGTVAKRLEPLFSKTSAAIDQINETLLTLITAQDIEDLRRMKMATAKINTVPNESTYEFRAGLVCALTLDAVIENVRNVDDVKIKVSYPDRQAHIMIPNRNHFRLISSDSVSGTSSHRLYTTVNICHNAWSDPSVVEISVILDHRENQASSIILNQDLAYSADESQIIEIGQPLELKVHPQCSALF